MTAAIWLIFKQSFLQFFALFGVVLAGAAVLTLLSRWTNNVFRQFRFPNFGMYVFGFIGVPVHEFCHALFCRLFFHEVKDVKWFDPKGNDGSYGSVTHLYNPWNLYHRIGHFFIGLGPVLLGPLLILLLLYAFLPSTRSALHLASEGTIWSVTQALFKSLFIKANLTSPWFYGFVYLATCISSQMELSREDMKQAATGIVPIFLVLLLLNLTSWYFQLGWHQSLYTTGFSISAVAASVFTLACSLSALNFLLCAFALHFINRVSGAEGINPFSNGSSQS